MNKSCEINFKSLNDSELLALTKQKVAIERQTALEVIECLREIFQRRVHLTMSYPSLHVFCVKELGYSDSEAYTRLSALKLLEEVPETRQALGEGSLSLTKAAQIQTFFKRQEKRKAPLEAEAKQNVIESLQHLSGREIERELVNLGLELGDSEVGQREQVRPAGPGVTEVKLYLPDQTVEKLEKLKSLLSHKLPNPTYGDLINELAEIALNKLDPERRQESAVRKSDRSRREIPGSPRRGTEETEASTKVATVDSKAPRMSSNGSRSRYIPINTRRKIWREAQGMCQFRDESNPLGRTCGSRHKLQIEHKIPWAKGGTNDPENLTLLCVAHNLHRTKQEFGAEKIEKQEFGVRGQKLKTFEAGFGTD